MDWKKLYLSNPELIIALAVIVSAVAIFVWWYRDHTAKERIATLQDANNQHVAALNTQITSLEGRLRDTREDLRIAKEEQQRITNEVELLRAENAKLVSEIRGLQATAPASQQPQLTIIHNSTSQMVVRINSIDQANTQLGTTLQTITGKLQATERSDTFAGALTITLK